ncbi:FadR/GntR family transcriptional regulator [Aeromicrobium sp. CF4.19]|uniref:FadR/GntR family transcriptional regulator n=1 Tax=Aeromicrobium sp. CF4.19 TaxID=3373082 RepID=UPI003EE797F9
MTTTTLSLSERLAESIVELIRDEGLAPGDALLSSRDLARRFDVTTPTLREALRRLEANDLIRFRHGSGTYVGDGIGRRLMSNPYAGPVDHDSVLELVEARLVLEPGIAASAATQRTDADLQLLDAATANALEPQRGDERPAVHFHVAVAAAGRNRLVREAVEALLRVRVRDQVEIRHRYDDRDRDHTEHLQIVEAIRDRDASAAEHLTREHLESIRATVLARATEGGLA